MIFNSLVSFFAYFSQFWGFVVFGLMAGIISEKAFYIYMIIFNIGLFYTPFALFRAKNADLYVTTKIKGTLKKPDNSKKLFFACTIIPFVFHFFCLEDRLIIDILVCTFLAYFLVYNGDTGFSLNIFSLNTFVYRVKVGKEEIALIVEDESEFPEFGEEDTVEISHISGNYYILMNVIKQEELLKNNAAETVKSEIIKENVVETKVVELNTVKPDSQNINEKEPEIIEEKVNESGEKTVGI